jgi:glycosyltransferase involved in cell wall biosynthesis
MHVLILNQTFHPDVAATGQLMWDVARHLVAKGHRVSVVTSRNYYGTDRRHEKAHEILQGVEIHRLGGTAFGKTSMITRLVDFASFYTAAFLHLSRSPSPDVILALTSPPLVATLAMLQRQFARTPSGTRVRFVYHLMDLYPDALIAAGSLKRSSLLARALRAITTRTLDTADAVIALGRDMRDRLLHEYPHRAKADRIHVIPPWADGAALVPTTDRAASPLANKLDLVQTFNIVYSGNLGIAHDLDTLTAAMDATRADANLRWVFIGGGKRFDDLKRHATQHAWSHVVFLPFQDRESLNDSLNLADVHLVSQLPAFSGVVVPSKLFGILAVGKPSIFVGPADAEGARIIAENTCGYVIGNGDSEGLVRAVRGLRDDATLCHQMGTRARASFDRYYDRHVACIRIEELLIDVLQRQ